MAHVVSPAAEPPSVGGGLDAWAAASTVALRTGNGSPRWGSDRARALDASPVAAMARRASARRAVRAAPAALLDLESGTQSVVPVLIPSRGRPDSGLPVGHRAIQSSISPRVHLRTVRAGAGSTSRRAPRSLARGGDQCRASR